jgi:hypothetical protein
MFGYTIRGVKPGDAVCVFNGAPTPHVLRKASYIAAGVVRWKIVGHAYVDGLMHGEADEMALKEKDIVLV